MRVDLLLTLGRSQEALANARSLFNVSSMTGTTNAIEVMVRCLQANYPQDREILRRFRQEQQDGSTGSPQAVSTSSPQAGSTSSPQAGASASAAPPPAASTLMAGIKIDPAPYEEAALDLLDDYKGLTARGNLLLLAGKPREAREVFERVYEAAPDWELGIEAKSFARCLKAQDGTSGRATAFVLSLRPKEGDVSTTSPATQPAEGGLKVTPGRNGEGEILRDRRIAAKRS